MKPLGQERPVLLLPLQPDSPVEAKVSLQPQTQGYRETQQPDTITLDRTPSPGDPQDSQTLSGAPTPPMPSPDPVVVHNQAPPSPGGIKPRRLPLLPPKASDKPHVEVEVVKDEKERCLDSSRVPPLPPKASDKPRLEVEVVKEERERCPEGTQAEDRRKENNIHNGAPEPQRDVSDWPPPYVPPALDAPTMQNVEDLPDLPPPPFCYADQNGQILDSEPPCLGNGTDSELQPHSVPQCSAPSLGGECLPQERLPPKKRPQPATSLHLIQKETPSSRPPLPPALSSSSPRVPPPKPTKFPVSLCVPVNVGDRRPSNTSQYDNLSEGDEEDRYLERLLEVVATLPQSCRLGSTPQETPGMYGLPPQPMIDGEYDPTLYPLPPPPVFLPPSPVFLPPSPSPLPHSFCTLPSLPQEAECEGESWVEDSIIPPPPPCFADRLAAFQSSPNTHRASSSSSGYSQGHFTGAPRGHSAFPAPLLYPGSPSVLSRPSGQSAVGMPSARSSPDFYRMHPGSQQLPKSVTF